MVRGIYFFSHLVCFDLIPEKVTITSIYIYTPPANANSAWLGIWSPFVTVYALSIPGILWKNRLIVGNGLLHT